VNITEMYDACKELQTALEGKGMTLASVELKINWTDFSPVIIDISFYCGDKRHAELFKLEHPTEEALARGLDEAFQWVNSFRSLEEQKRRDYLKEVGRLVDLGRELGMDEIAGETGNIIEMLEATMRALSENILENHSS